MLNQKKQKELKGLLAAAELIQEAKGQRTGPPAPLMDTLPVLSESLESVLALVLSEFDYRGNLASNTAIACRILAAYANRFESLAKTTEPGPALNKE